MQRRVFIARLIQWLKGAGLVIFMPVFMNPKIVNAGQNADSGTNAAKGMSLREFSEKKRHHVANRFQSPFPDSDHGNPWRILKWKLFTKNHHRELYRNERVIPVQIDWSPVSRHTGVSITFINHASVMIKDNNTYLLVDPVFDGLFPLIKDFSPLHFDLKTMPSPDHVLITHGHYDHLDKPSLESLDPNTHVITPLGYTGIFKNLGMLNQHRLDWFESYREGECEVILLPCKHWTMRNPLIGPNRSMWGSYLIKTSGGVNIFISGDTAYHGRYAELGRDFPIDLAVFNLGAYEPRWFMASSHINPRETVRAFKALGARQLAVIHWGTFRLGDEPVYLPPIAIKKEMEKAGLIDRLVQLNHGNTLFF